MDTDKTNLSFLEAFEELVATPNNYLPLAAQIAKVFDRIVELQGQGWTISQIADRLKQLGCEIEVVHFKKILYRIRRNRAGKTQRVKKGEVPVARPATVAAAPKPAASVSVPAVSAVPTTKDKDDGMSAHQRRLKMADELMNKHQNPLLAGLTTQKE